VVNRDLVAAKLRELEDRLQQVRAHRKTSIDELGQNRDARELVAFNLMLAVQVCADLSSHIVADQGWAPALTLAEGFHRLHEKGVLSAATSAALANAVGFRNVVAHGYAGVDLGMLHAASHSGVADLERFAREVATWTTSQGA
jgi:uncharacterized protein YutE (UPF0331/DUF86 family)